MQHEQPLLAKLGTGQQPHLKTMIKKAIELHRCDLRVRLYLFTTWGYYEVLVGAKAYC